MEDETRFYLTIANLRQKNAMTNFSGDSVSRSSVLGGTGVLDSSINFSNVNERSSSDNSEGGVLSANVTFFVIEEGKENSGHFYCGYKDSAVTNEAYVSLLCDVSMIKLIEECAKNSEGIRLTCSLSDIKSEIDSGQKENTILAKVSVLEWKVNESAAECMSAIESRRIIQCVFRAT